MFLNKFFGNRFFAQRYFPKEGGFSTGTDQYVLRTPIKLGPVFSRMGCK